MSGIAERLRARLAAQRAGEAPVSLRHVGREEVLKDFKLAIAFQIYARKLCYINYMETGFSVCDSLVDREQTHKWFRSFCLEPYPDVCMCGHRFFGGNESVLRRDCIVCKGDWRVKKIDGYTVQRLADHLLVHQTWVEYAAAWALAGYKPTQITK